MSRRKIVLPSHSRGDPRDIVQSADLDSSRLHLWSGDGRRVDGVARALQVAIHGF